MKKIVYLVPLMMLLFACNSGKNNNENVDLSNFKNRISYALGADMGANLSNVPKEIFNQLDKEVMESSFLEYLTNTKSSDHSYDVLQATLSNPAKIDTSKYSMKDVSHAYGSIFGVLLRKSLENKKAMDRIDPEISLLGFSNSLVGADTLIEPQKRAEMIVNFNNDLNKMASETFMKSKMEEYAANIKSTKEGDYVLVTEKEGKGGNIDLSKEYKIIYTMTNVAGDTVISTIKDIKLGEEINAQIVNVNDIVFPEVWREATKFMKIGGEYTIYSPYKLAYGEEGLSAPNAPNYVVQPFSAITIHSKVLQQYELNYNVKQRGKEAIEKAKKEPNAYVDPSGYVLITLKEGAGKKVPKGGDVKAHYILTNAMGQTIQNSYVMAARQKQGAPTFSLKHVVKGWQMAIPKMKIGGKYKLVLPYDLAYGEKGSRGIAPYSTLTFQIEILDAGAPGSLVQAQPKQQFSQQQMQQLQKQLKQRSQQNK